MNRLQQELQRLFGAATHHDTSTGTRALILELAQPADWGAVVQLVQGVVQDLALPAPAIAVSGTNGFQLWFSCLAPVTDEQAQSFLRGLIARYWPQVAPQRLRLYTEFAAPMGATDAKTLPQAPPAVPQEVQPGQWSAFISPDLGALFADTPWLGTAPSPQAQAEVLSTVQSITPQAFAVACPQQNASDVGPAQPSLAGGYTDPRAFLQNLMNDPSAPLRWRVEAAKALLQQPG